MLVFLLALASAVAAAPCATMGASCTIGVEDSCPMDAICHSATSKPADAVCVWPSRLGQACSVDDDCVGAPTGAPIYHAAASACRRGRCSRDGLLGWQCGSDDDCLSSNCVNSRCAAHEQAGETVVRRHGSRLAARATQCGVGEASTVQLGADPSLGIFSCAAATLGDVGDSCSADSDCSTCLLCHAGSCSLPAVLQVGEAASEADLCESGVLSADSSLCAAAPSAPPRCTNSSDCSAASKCAASGFCLPRRPPPAASCVAERQALATCAAASDCSRASCAAYAVHTSCLAQACSEQACSLVSCAARANAARLAMTQSCDRLVRAQACAADYTRSVDDGSGAGTGVDGDEDAAQGRAGQQTGMIVGIVFGCLAAVVLIGFALQRWHVWRRDRVVLLKEGSGLVLDDDSDEDV